MTGGGLDSPRPESDSLFFELMDFTYTLSVQNNLSPFVILDQDKDRVIMLINYFIEKGGKIEPETSASKTPNDRQKNYDGFWDF